MDGMKRLLLEILPNGKMVGEGTHNENKRNVNNDLKNDNMKYLKKDIEGLKEGLKNLLEEKIFNGENVIDKAHGENKRNVNHDFINSNIGTKTHHVPKIDMRKFDGKDPVTWILQMEQFFDLHNVKNTQKVHITTLYFEPNQFAWYRWLCACKEIVTSAIFTKEMKTHYADTKKKTFFSQWINLK